MGCCGVQHPSHGTGELLAAAAIRAMAGPEQGGQGCRRRRQGARLWACRDHGMVAAPRSPLPAPACHGPRGSATSGPSAPAPGDEKAPRLTRLDMRDRAAGEGTHRGTRALPCGAARRGRQSTAGSRAPAPDPHICVAAVLKKFSIYTFALFVGFFFFSFLFFFFLSQPSRCNSSTLRRAPPMQLWFGHTWAVAAGQSEVLGCRGGLPASPLALRGRWLLTGTGCSRTCWASPPPPRRSRHCCTRRRISCAAAAARCSSQRRGRRKIPGIPPRPRAASSGRWHSPAAPGGSPALAPHGTPALWDGDAQSGVLVWGCPPRAPTSPVAYLGRRGLRHSHCGTRRWAGHLG